MAERSFWNPMTNVGAFRDRGITIVRGEGSTVWDDAGNALLDVSAALWYCNIGYGRAGARRGGRRADARARVVQDLRRIHVAADRGAGGAGDGARPARRRQGLLHLRRRRVDRHGREARARLLDGGRQARQARRSSRGSSPTTARTRTARRSAEWPRSSRRYGRLVPEVEQVPWDDAEALAEAIDRLGADRRGGVLRRAGHRRRRRDDPARRLPRPRPGDLPRTRGAARRSTR